MMKSLASASVVAETRERLQRLTEQDRPLWGKMTVRQMVRHLSCAYEVALAERKVEAVKGPPPWLMKFAALRLPLQWPKGKAETPPELKRAVEKDPSGPFGELVDEAVAKMEAVASGTRWQESHPFFGAMTSADWMRWGYLHADHHLRQFGR
ncbi:MAG: DUF1569 domain-containing protein [Acidobacteria bacterium]|nr:DUF1569 domain-containing protein [Acidobacteriota bacterium]